MYGVWGLRGFEIQGAGFKGITRVFRLLCDHIVPGGVWSLGFHLLPD